MVHTVTHLSWVLRLHCTNFLYPRMGGRRITAKKPPLEVLPQEDWFLIAKDVFSWERESVGDGWGAGGCREE